MPLQQRAESNFLPSLLSGFLAVLVGIPADAEGAGTINKNDLLYCERFVEFLTDLLSQVNKGVPHYMTPPTLVVCKCSVRSDCCDIYGALSIPSLLTMLPFCSFPHGALCTLC